MDRETAARILGDVGQAWWLSPDELERLHPDEVEADLEAAPIGTITAEQVEQALRVRRDDPRWAE